MYKNNGYTLIELIVVFVLIGVFAAMAFPSFLTLIRKQEVRSTTQNITDLINYTRSESNRRNQIAFIYPAYFRSNAKLNGQASSWSNANGMVAFMDHLYNLRNNISQYDSKEEIRSTQIKENSIVLSASTFVAGNHNSNSVSPSEIGLIIYPNGGLKVSNNYRAISQGNSGYMVKITATNKFDTKICHVLWVDNLARARNCPNGKNSEHTPKYIKNICNCNN